MIVVLFGQPGSGKTTLAKEICKISDFMRIDGDELREIFNNKDYSRSGRIKNLHRASEIAIYIDSIVCNNVILSLAYPYEEARNYLDRFESKVKWVQLDYCGIRGKEKYHIEDFEPKENCLNIDTSKNTIDESVKKILNYVAQENTY